MEASLWSGATRSFMVRRDIPSIVFTTVGTTMTDAALSGMKRIPFLRIFSVSLLVTGTTVGAGILALPIQTGLAGALPSLAAMMVIWGIMLATGRILAHRLITSDKGAADLASLLERELGPAGKWLLAAGYFIIFYGLLVAYLAGATSVLVSLIPVAVPGSAWMIAFFLLATGITLFGEDMVRRGNVAIMALLAVAFAALFIMAAYHVDVQRFRHSDWYFLPSAAPIIACAFGYHQIIPTVCRGLDWDSRSVWTALWLGTGFALVMNLAWVLAAIGAIPLAGPGASNLVAAFEKNLPATVPLSLILHSKLMTTTGMVFAFAAILTSYLGVGIALIGFIQDIGSSVVGKVGRRAAAILTFGPPLVIALVYPNIFLKVLNLVGGFGILLVFGILPCLVFLKATRNQPARRRVAGYALLAVFGLLMALELAQECGWLRINPDVEHWNVQQMTSPNTDGQE
ncbi:MAG: tryptophan/tyrosine permease [Planctomycetes bacterium]|nr:tryptophan/tyrosine permease [Planctomycetota bacterium]